MVSAKVKGELVTVVHSCLILVGIILFLMEHTHFYRFCGNSSLKLTYGPKDLLQALDRAKTPYNAGSDKDLQKEYDEQALQAYKELVEKQAFVEDYFSKEIKISLNYLQLISMKQVKEFINKK